MSQKMLVLLMFLIPTCLSIEIKCYSNGNFKLPPIGNYSNTSCSLCRCLAYNQSYSPYQCDESNNNCFLYRNDLSPSDLKVQRNQTVCLFNQTTTPTNNLTSPSFAVMTTTLNTQYYVLETLYVNNNVTSYNFTLKLTAFKNNHMTNVNCFYSVSSFISTFTLNETNSSYECNFALKSGFALDPGLFGFNIQFSMPGEIRNTTADKYEIWIQSTSSPTLIGHF